MTSRIVAAGIATFLLTAPLSDARADCLTRVADFAKEMCGAIESEGYHKAFQAEGKVDVSIDGIVRRYIGGADTTFDVSVVREEIKLVAKGQLGLDRADTRSCRIAMAKTFMVHACGSVADDRS